jgi:hypothetical protein
MPLAHAKRLPGCRFDSRVLHVQTNVKASNRGCQDNQTIPLHTGLALLAPRKAHEMEPALTCF